MTMNVQAKNFPIVTLTCQSKQMNLYQLENQNPKQSPPRHYMAGHWVEGYFAEFWQTPLILFLKNYSLCFFDCLPVQVYIFMPACAPFIYDVQRFQPVGKSDQLVVSEKLKNTECLIISWQIKKNLTRNYFSFVFIVLLSKLLTQQVPAFFFSRIFKAAVAISWQVPKSQKACFL